MSDEASATKAFEAAAEQELAALLDKIDALGLDLEAELSMGILTIDFPDGAKYVVNSHRAARQIWMAAERTAWHFDPDGARWIARKSNEELRPTLSAVLSKKTGKAISLA